MSILSGLGMVKIANVIKWVRAESNSGHKHMVVAYHLILNNERIREVCNAIHFGWKLKYVTSLVHRKIFHEFKTAFI